MTTTSNRSDIPFDAAIVGAGVAGAATAINLVAAGWRVALLHRRDNRDALESISPQACRSLNELSLQLGDPLLKLTSWWGTERETFRECSGARVVRRLELAQKLRACATETGAIPFELHGCFNIVRAGNAWDVGFLEGAERNCRLRVAHLVDASGRASVAARKTGANRHTIDTLFSVTASLRATGITGVWTESVETGWWNLCSTRELGSLSFFGARPAVEYVRRYFRDCFASTLHLTKLLVPDIEHLSTRPCGSSRLCPTAGNGWVAVGDAAATVNPLTSSGVARALRDAAMAKDALRDRSRAYDAFHQADFQSYYALLGQHYALERRWPRSAFWKRAVVNSPPPPTEDLT